MLNIPCPWCGPRPHIEFTYGGDATTTRPHDTASLDLWVDYVYYRDNPCGPHRELWHHYASCGQWIELRRDTLTHAVLNSSSLPGTA